MKQFPRLRDGSIDIISLPAPPSQSNRGRSDRRRNSSSSISSSPPPPPLIQHDGRRGSGSESGDGIWATTSPKMALNNQVNNNYTKFKQENLTNARPSTVGSTSSRTSSFPLLSPLSDNKVSIFRRQSSKTDDSIQQQRQRQTNSIITPSPFHNRNTQSNQYQTTEQGGTASRQGQQGGSNEMNRGTLPNMNNETANAIAKHKAMFRPSNDMSLNDKGGSGGGGERRYSGASGGNGTGEDVGGDRRYGGGGTERRYSGERNGVNIRAEEKKETSKTSNKYSKWVVDAWTEQGPHHSNEDRWCCFDDLFSLFQETYPSNNNGGSAGTIIPSRSKSKYSHQSSTFSPYVKNTFVQLPKLGIQSESRRSSLRRDSLKSSQSNLRLSSGGISSSISTSNDINLNVSKISLWCCFDGHGGGTAAEFCRVNASIEVLAALSSIYGKEFTINNNNGGGGSSYNEINSIQNDNKEEDEEDEGRILIAVLEKAISKLEEGFKKYIKGDDSGCCATLVLCKKGKIAVANLGDCQAMVFDSKILPNQRLGGKINQTMGDRSGLKNNQRSSSATSKFGSRWRYKIRGNKKNNNDKTNGGNQSLKNQFVNSLLENGSTSNNEPISVISYELTTPHRASDPLETARILSVGGTVVRGRVMGVLEPSRAIGDFDLKRMSKCKTAVSIIPSVSYITLFNPPPKLSIDTLSISPTSSSGGGGGGEIRKRRGSYSNKNISSFVTNHNTPPFMVIASDGVWDFMTVSEVGTVVRECHESTYTQSGNITRASLMSCNVSAARKLVEEAISAGSEDDITVLVVTFIE